MTTILWSPNHPNLFDSRRCISESSTFQLQGILLLTFKEIQQNHKITAWTVTLRDAYQHYGVSILIRTRKSKSETINRAEQRLEILVSLNISLQSHHWGSVCLNLRYDSQKLTSAIRQNLITLPYLAFPDFSWLVLTWLDLTWLDIISKRTTNIDKDILK